MTQIIGYLPSSASDGSDWDRTFGGGNRAICYRPDSSVPHSAITPLASNQRLKRIGLSSAIDGAPRDTTINVGIYEFVDASTVDLLWDGELVYAGASNTGYQFFYLDVDVDASAWSGKRLGVGMAPARDGGAAPVKYHGGLGTSARYDSGIGSAYDLPDPWSGTGTAFPESIWAEFEDAEDAVTGTIESTLANAESNISASVSASGTISSTLANSVTDIDGDVSVSGSVASTLANNVVDIDADVSVAGSVDSTLANSTADIEGEVEVPGVSGAISATLANAAFDSEGEVSLSGTISASTANAVADIDGDISVIGTLSSTLSNVRARIRGLSGEDTGGDTVYAITSRVPKGVSLASSVKTIKARKL